MKLLSSLPPPLKIFISIKLETSFVRGNEELTTGVIKTYSFAWIGSDADKSPFPTEVKQAYLPDLLQP